MVALAGVAVAVSAILLNGRFFLRPGAGAVLGGLGHHALTLVWLLALTAGTRTVSLSALGTFWLLGVWTVYALAYLIEKPLANQFGIEQTDVFVPVWAVPVIEETLKVLPVVAYLLLVARKGNRRAAISDGALLGFMVGAGVAFMEDAHMGVSEQSGGGWGQAPPWSILFPTAVENGGYFFLQHAIWSALAGLGVGLAVMLRRFPLWLIGLIFPLLGLANHITGNYFAGNLFALLGRGEVPRFYGLMRSLTAGGRAQMLALLGGLVAAVAFELLVLRWVGKRDRMFPALPLARALSPAGDLYARLRHSVYYAAWRTKRAGGYPDVSDADHGVLIALAYRLGLLRAVAPQPPEEPTAEAPAPPIS